MGSISSILASGGVKPTAVQNGVQAVAINTTHPTTAGVANQTVQVASGSCTAGVLKTALSVTGKGALTWLGYDSADATSRTHRLRITIDGVVVLDKTSPATTIANRTHAVHGSWNANVSVMPVIEGTPLLYDQSLLIEYASSLTETDKSTISYINYLR